jgi:hypothetical protein
MLKNNGSIHQNFYSPAYLIWASLMFDDIYKRYRELRSK